MVAVAPVYSALAGLRFCQILIAEWQKAKVCEKFKGFVSTTIADGGIQLKGSATVPVAAPSVALDARSTKISVQRSFPPAAADRSFYWLVKWVVRPVQLLLRAGKFGVQIGRLIV